MAKLKTVTLGCKVNQYETEYVRQGLVGIGYEDAGDEESAELCVVNTCTVTNEGDSKSRQVIRRLARDNPDSRIVVMGCYATRAPDEVAALPNVAEVVTDKRELPDLLGRFGVVDIPTGISTFGDRQRAYVKVQDGCLLRCSYCIIPHVRPSLTSRPVEPILDEVRQLVDNGHREIVLTGIHLGHYGVDWNRGRKKEDWVRLSHLVRMIAELDGDFRVRLSSIEATEVTRELLDVMEEHADRVCPHLHICLQSGSDTILRRTRRRWGAKRFVDRCALLKERIPKASISTDIIVGFPGETEHEFEQSCDVAREVGFSKIHAFPFSARRGTPAVDYPDQITKQEKQRRVHELMTIEADLRESYFGSLVGDQLQVLFERTDSADTTGRRILGTSCRYTPVELTCPNTADADSQLGELVNVSAEGVVFRDVGKSDKGIRLRATVSR